MTSFTYLLVGWLLTGMAGMAVSRASHPQAGDPVLIYMLVVAFQKKKKNELEACNGLDRPGTITP